VTSDPGVKVVDGNGIVAGCALVEALVRPVVVAMALVLVEDGASVSFVVDQEPVGALGANAADESLGIAIRLRGLDRDLDHVEAFEGEDGVEGVKQHSPRSCHGRGGAGWPRGGPGEG
jgi:hypothetical protein